jgi:hypothetical protein
MGELRFFIDHWTIHDRHTGRHVRTDADFGPGRKYEEDGAEQCCELLNELNARATHFEALASANRYHQRLGAKWMVEAIIRECRTTLALNRNAQDFANDLERRWEDEAFWRPKV